MFKGEHNSMKETQIVKSNRKSRIPVLTIDRTAISLCPTPTVSIKIIPKPAASQSNTVSRVFRATPPILYHLLQYLIVIYTFILNEWVGHPPKGRKNENIRVFYNKDDTTNNPFPTFTVRAVFL
jgi:hypothetical protein